MERETEDSGDLECRQCGGYRKHICGCDDPIFTAEDVEFLRLVSGQWRSLRLGPHQQIEFDRIVDALERMLPA